MSDYVTKTNLLSALGRFKENTDDLYETKADANDLKNALSATNKRVTNLEQKAGDEIVVDYPSSTYGVDEVPANVAEYAKVTKLRGVSEVVDGSLVDTMYGGVRSDGVNIWNEEYYGGGYINNNGTIATYGYGTRILSKNYISVLPSTAYFFKVPYQATSYGIRIAWYDENKNNISVTDFYTNTVTSPANARYMRFNTNIEYGSSIYRHDIQVCLNSYAGKTTYHPHMTDTLSIPSPVILRGVGTAHDELDVETGVVTRKMSENTDLATLTWVEEADSKRWKSTSLVGIINPVNISDVANMISDKYPTISYTEMNTDYSKFGIAVTATGNVFARISPNTAGASPTGGLVYEKATPTTDPDPVPILDPFLKVEGGGTIRPIQTQTTEIDSAMTAEYLSLGANA